MNAQDCLQMLREIKDVSFATVDEEGRPHNRIIDVMIVEKNRLIFCTGRGKDFYRQLTSNPRVAVCGMNKNWQMIRLEGTAKKLEDQKKYIDRIFDENPSMNDVYPGSSRYILDPFVIGSGSLEFFDLGKSPIYRESFTFSESSTAVEELNTPKNSVSENDRNIREPGAPERGFRITDSCIGCGTCQANCPQQCIEEGTPFAIRQENCLHCGLCFENCPVDAIERRGQQD